jgi:hypothetical protein
MLRTVPPQLARSPSWAEGLRDCSAIVVASALVTLVVQPFQNAPFIDDWAYAWSVQNLLTSGRLERC